MSEKLKNFCKIQTRRSNMYLKSIKYNISVGEPILVFTLSDFRELLLTLKDEFNSNKSKEDMK